MSWRDEQITEKQKKMIEQMQENAGMNGAIIPPFYGKTKGEASDYITENIHRQYIDESGRNENAGDRV